MAPTTRAIGGSNVNGETVDDSTRRYVDEALAGIRRAKNKELEEEFLDADDSLEDMETDGVQPQISLNALSGMSSF
ncbi:hypothetical protein Tco_0869638 [Tanacetum coccineum]